MRPALDAGQLARDTTRGATRGEADDDDRRRRRRDHKPPRSCGTRSGRLAKLAQSSLKFRSRPPAVGWRLGQRPRDRGGNPERHRRSQLRDGPGLRGNVLVDDAVNRRTGEGWVAREHLIEHAAKAVEIAPAVELPAARALLWAHVQRGPELDPGSG